MKHYDRLKQLISEELKSVDDDYEFALEHQSSDHYICHVIYRNYSKKKIRFMADSKYIAVYFTDNIWMEIKRKSPSIKYFWIALLS